MRVEGMKSLSLQCLCDDLSERMKELEARKEKCIDVVYQATVVKEKVEYTAIMLIEQEV